MQIYPLGSRIGQYEIASHPMQGGMGVVYFCLDHANNDRPVALKTFKPEFLPDRAARDRFLREGTAWVELGRHAHIVRCYEVEYIDPTAFLALELIAKEQGMAEASLRSWLGQPMPLQQALLFALQIARGLGYANARIPGFVHRDLKPENVLVGADKLPGTNVNRLRVTDFGLATILEGEGESLGSESPSLQANPRSTQLTHGVTGTPLYMAPEQWHREAVGAYTDIYALGCILYEMLTGHFAANGGSIPQLQAAHCAGDLRPLPADLPHEVRELLQRSLALRPMARYPGWDEIIRALEAAYAALDEGAAPQAEIASSESLEERRQTGWSYNAMGLAYLDMGKAKVAADYFEKAIHMARETSNRSGEGAALGNLGVTYKDLGDAQRAIGYYEQQMEISREIGDQRGEGNALGNLGVAHKNLGNVRRAIGYYEQSLIIKREIGDRRGEGNSLSNMGLAYTTLGDARRAIECYEQGLVIDRKIGNQRGEGAALNNLGLTYEDLGDVRRAIGYYEQSLIIKHEICDQRGEGNSLGNLGNAYLILGDARRAIGYYEQAIAIQREIGDLNGIAGGSFNMALLYEQQGEPARALPLAQEAAQAFARIGHPEYTRRAQELVAKLGGNSAPSPDPAFQRGE